MHLGGWIPDFGVRFGIRRATAQHLENLATAGVQGDAAAILNKLALGPIIDKDSESADEELDSSFFSYHLGPKLKTSLLVYPDEKLDIGLEAAETAALELLCSRADLSNGQTIVDLNSRWGSAALFVAEKYPKSQVTAVTLSDHQADYIKAAAKKAGLKNLTIIQKSLNDLSFPKGTVDRLLAIQVLPHVVNWEKFFSTVSGWLDESGKAFIETFSHAEFAAEITAATPGWLGEHFLHGFIPADATLHGLLSSHSTGLETENFWRVSGIHVSQAAEDWLAKLDKHTNHNALALAGEDPTNAEEGTIPSVGLEGVRKLRLFYLTMAEAFGFGNGTEFGVAHYLLRHKKEEEE